MTPIMDDTGATLSALQALGSLQTDILDHLYDGVYCVTLSQKIILWNKSAETITGYKKEEVIGRCCSDNILCHVNGNGDELCVKGCPLSQTLKDGKIRDANVYLHHWSGHRVPVSIRVSPIYNDEQQIVGAMEVFTGNSQNIDMLTEFESFRNETFTDGLTRVGNRRYAEFELKKRFDDLKAFRIEFGILLFDIDRIKAIVDTHGSVVGDKVRQMVAKTVYNMIRSLDSICRWDADRFILILPNVDSTTLAAVGEKIRLFIEKTWLQAGREIIRITISPKGTMADENDTIESLVQRADGLTGQTGQNRPNTTTIG